MAVAADFPYLIKSTILLAPAGIIRRLPDQYDTIFLRYSTLLPLSYIRNVVGKTLGFAFTHWLQEP